MKNEAIVNEDFQSSQADLKKEIERLKQELEKYNVDTAAKEIQTLPFLTYGCERCQDMVSENEYRDGYIISKSSPNQECKEVMVESLNFTEEDSFDCQEPFNEISDFNMQQL